MISADQLNQAREILARGVSLYWAACYLGVSTADLDQALWRDLKRFQPSQPLHVQQGDLIGRTQAERYGGRG